MINIYYHLRYLFVFFFQKEKRKRKKKKIKIQISAYKFCKLGKYISWVGIGPESPLLLKFLFHFVFFFIPKFKKIILLNQKFKSEKNRRKR